MNANRNVNRSLTTARTNARGSGGMNKLGRRCTTPTIVLFVFLATAMTVRVQADESVVNSKHDLSAAKKDLAREGRGWVAPHDVAKPADVLQAEQVPHLVGGRVSDNVDEVPNGSFKAPVPVRSDKCAEKYKRIVVPLCIAEVLRRNAVEDGFFSNRFKGVAFAP